MAWQRIVAALLAQGALAQNPGYAKGSDFLRFGCSQLVVERTDPIVNPGLTFTPHMHQVVGGSSFNVTVWRSAAFQLLGMFVPSHDGS